MKPGASHTYGKLAQYVVIGVLAVCALWFLVSFAYSLAVPVIQVVPAPQTTTNTSATPASQQPSLDVQQAPAPIRAADPLAKALTASSTIVRIGNTSMRMAVVDTDAAREQGLSGVKGLLSDEGMLFVFQRNFPYAFWMKDMLMPIDMVWLDQTKHVIFIVGGATPNSYPHDFIPPAPALYVLELPAGFSRAHGLQIGDIVSF